MLTRPGSTPGSGWMRDLSERLASGPADPPGFRPRRDSQNPRPKPPENSGLVRNPVPCGARRLESQFGTIIRAL